MHLLGSGRVEPGRVNYNDGKELEAGLDLE